MKEKAKAKEILQKIIPFLGIILMIIIFQVGGEGKLLTKGNINSILNQTVYIAIMAFGAIFVYSHGGMDSYTVLLQLQSVFFLPDCIL